MLEAVARQSQAWFKSMPAAVSREASLLLATSLATVCIQFLVRTGVHDAAALESWQFHTTVLLQVAFGLAFSFVRYSRFSSFLTTLTRSCALGLCLLLLAEPTDLTLALDEGRWRFDAVEQLYWPAVVFAVLGCFRPSFLFFPACYVISVRYLMESISGYTGATLDIRYFVEMAQYLSLTIIGLSVARRLVGEPATTPSPRIGNRLVHDRGLEYCIGFNAIAFHFGNYLWAGIAKVAAGPSVLSWILENRTETIIPLAIEKGTFLFAQWPALTDTIYQAFSATRPFANAFVVATQLLAVIAVFRRRWIIVASLAYDALHLGLFLLQGLFFWPWVWINVAVLQAVRRLTKDSVPPVAELSCVLVMTIGGAVGLINFSYLAWYESDAIRIPYFEVQAPNGGWVRVPNSFFGSESYSVSHSKIDVSRQAGQYAPTPWGGLPYDEFRQRIGCRDPAGIPVESPETESERAEREKHVTRFVRSRHQRVLTRVNESGQYNPYLRFHHHPSNPLLYREFNQLDLRKVKAYRMVTQSVCLPMKDGKLDRRVFSEYETRIDVAR